jgi:hypothetical protein
MLAPTRPRQQAEGDRSNISRTGSPSAHLRAHDGRNREQVKACRKCGARQHQADPAPPLLVEKSKGSALLPLALCETSSLAIWHRRAIEVVRDATAAPRCSRPTMPHGLPRALDYGVNSTD